MRRMDDIHAVAIKEYDEYSVEMVRDFCRGAEHTLTEMAAVKSADEASMAAVGFQDDIEMFIFDMDRRTDIRDGVSDVGFIASQQLNIAYQFGQPERIAKLLKSKALLEHKPWLSAVGVTPRPHGVSDSQYAICQKLAAMLDVKGPRQP